MALVRHPTNRRHQPDALDRERELDPIVRLQVRQQVQAVLIEVGVVFRAERDDGARIVSALRAQRAVDQGRGGYRSSSHAATFCPSSGADEMHTHSSRVKISR